MDRDLTDHEPDRKAAASGDGGRPGHLGFVAHEIRNPLATALWTAELLSRMSPEDRGGARGEKMSATCLRSVSRVRQLVEDHFLCERLDAGGLQLRIEALGARETVDGVLQRRPSDAAPAGAEIEDAVGVEADRNLLERALDALIAVAGAERTPVSISARATDGDVSFRISGRPADPASLVDPTKGSPSDHTGRALAVPLARRIAAALSGDLTAREGDWLLTLRRARGYTPRPDSAGNP